jgi:hypothetical protein
MVTVFIELPNVAKVSGERKRVRSTAEMALRSFGFETEIPVPFPRVFAVLGIPMLDADNPHGLADIVANLLSFFGVVLTESGFELAGSRAESFFGRTSLQQTNDTIEEIVHTSLALYSDVFGWCTWVKLFLRELSFLLEVSQLAQRFGRS